jgi:hypothetical protein
MQAQCTVYHRAMTGAGLLQETKLEQCAFGIFLLEVRNR